MRIVIEFDIDKYDEHGIRDDDSLRLKQHMASQDMALALWELSQKVRSYYKYGFDGKDPSEVISEDFWDVLKENNVDLDSIVE